MKSITFYSYKGGVGRSLALANMAIRLAEIGKKVCVIDFDIEAPGLHSKFDKYINDGIDKGVVDYIDKYKCGDSKKLSIEDYSVTLNINKRFSKGIHFIPAGNVSKPEYWIKLARIDWFGMFYDKDGRGIEFFLDLRAKITNELNPDILLIDSRTGITESSVVTMSMLANEVVLMGANNSENLDGLSLVLNNLFDQRNWIYNKAPKVYLVLSRIPVPNDVKDKYKEAAVVKNARKRIIGNLRPDRLELIMGDNLSLEPLVIHSDRDLEYEESLKIGYQFRDERLDAHAQVSQDYLRLFNRITANWLTEKEIIRFNRIKKAELLLEKALKEDNELKKEQIIKEVLALDSELEAAHLLLAEIYENVSKEKEYIEHLKAAIKINSKNFEVYNMLGFFYKKKGDIERAKKNFKESLNLRRDNYGGLLGLAEIYENIDTDMANRIYGKVIEIYPGRGGGFNNYANFLRVCGKMEDAKMYVYRALEIDPMDPYGLSTLAEICAAEGDLKEFYRNIELAILCEFPIAEYLGNDFYRKFRGDEQLNELLSKYKVDVSSVSNKF